MKPAWGHLCGSSQEQGGAAYLDEPAKKSYLIHQLAPLSKLYLVGVAPEPKPNSELSLARGDERLKYEAQA